MNHEIDLARRVERLERQNRILRTGALAVLGVAGVALLASAATVCKTVTAEKFLVQDSSNRTRAILTAYDTGGPPKLSLLDEDGKEALSFGVGDDGVAFLELPGDKGPVRRNIVLSNDGLPVPSAPAKSNSCESAGTDDVAQR
jgi:hypothetical protein